MFYSTSFIGLGIYAIILCWNNTRNEQRVTEVDLFITKVTNGILSQWTNGLYCESQETEKPSNEETNEENSGNEEGGENDKIPEKHEEHEDPEEDDLDPNSKMIVTTYNPIIVTCHQDSFIRFWTMQVILNLTKI